MTNYSMAVDLDRCQGCRACMEACKIENNTPQGVFWMYVFRTEAGDYPDTKQSFLPRPCQHCNNAPCVKVCPVGARFRREDGLILTDSERCIGCRYCEVACPYGVNYYNWRTPENAFGDYELDAKDPDVAAVTGGLVPSYKNPDLDELQGDEQRLTAGGAHSVGVMEKCTFCVQRVDKGLEPACVNVCPVHAIHFGDSEDPESPFSVYVREHSSFKLLDDLGTDPSVVYLGGRPPDSETREIERPLTEVRQ
jgi:Fe-S-cluster-containing dehydrogenase component